MRSHALVLAPRLGAEIHPLEHELPQPQHRFPHLLALDDVPGRARALDDVGRQSVDPPRAGGPEELDLRRRQIIRNDDPRSQGVVDVVVYVGHPVHQPHQAPLQGRRLLRPGVIEDPVADRLRQVQPPPFPLQHVHHAKRLAVVMEAPPGALAQRLVERLLADVAEGRVAQVVPQADRLGEVLIQAQGPRHGARDAAGLDCVRESVAESTKALGPALADGRQLLDRLAAATPNLREFVTEARPAVAELKPLVQLLPDAADATGPFLEETRKLVESGPSDLRNFAPIIKAATPVTEPTPRA